MLIAYCLKGSGRLPNQDLCALRALGFRVPPQEPPERELQPYVRGFPDYRPLSGFSPDPAEAPSSSGLPAVKVKPLVCLELFAGVEALGFVVPWCYARGPFGSQ